MGGHYVTYKPEESLKAAPAIDYICVGDSDLSIHNIFESVLEKNFDRLREIKGVAFREGENIVNTGPGESIQNLDDLPMPAIHLWPLDEYIRQNRRYITFISKGCPYNCKFCGTWSTKQKIRFRSVPHIFEEMTMAYRAGFRYFYFFDDLFTINKELVYELCELIIKNNMEIKWSCLSHVKMIDQPMYGLPEARFEDSTNVDEITFDILFYCDGYHSTDCIAQKVARLYCLDENKSRKSKYGN